MLGNSRLTKLWNKLRNKQYRDSYVRTNIAMGVPFQIRAMRKQRGWTQKELAQRAGKKQSWISAIECDDRYGYSITTLTELASAFDVAIMVRFVPFSELVEAYADVSQAGLRVPSFEDESGWNAQRESTRCEATAMKINYHPSGAGMGSVGHARHAIAQSRALCLEGEVSTNSATTRYHASFSTT